MIWRLEVAAGRCCSIGETAPLISTVGGGTTKSWVLHFVGSGCIIISIGSIDQCCGTGQEVPIMIHNNGLAQRGVGYWLACDPRWPAVVVFGRSHVLYHHPCYCTCSRSLWIHTPTHRYTPVHKHTHMSIDPQSTTVISTFKILIGFLHGEISLWWWM